MRKLWDQRGAHSFACIHQWVDEHKFLQDGKSFQSAPGIISTAEKNHWSNHHAEHQSNMLLIDAASQSQPPACRKDRHQHNDYGEGQWRVNTDLHSWPKHEPRER